MVGGDESEGTAPGQWGSDRAGYRDLGLGARDSRQGVIWIQGYLRPREQCACLPSATSTP